MIHGIAITGFRGDWQMQDTFKIKGGGAVHESITKEAARLAGVPFKITESRITQRTGMLTG
jgi:hypothetical protein